MISAGDPIRNEPDFLWMLASGHFLSNDFAGAERPLLDLFRSQRASKDQKAAAASLEVARSHTVAEIKAAYEAFQSARKQVRIFRDELLNQADESRSIAFAAYREGATPLLTVLDAERTRAEVRQEFFKTIFDYQIALSDLELGVGREIRQ